MKPPFTIDEYDILSDYLISNLNFDKIYDSCASESKKLFSKETIIFSIKKLIKEYPIHFDTSIPGRVEALTSTLSVTKGYLNGYLYLMCNPLNSMWYLKEDKLFEDINYCKSNNKEHFIFNKKTYLRKQKIKQICQQLKNIK